MPEEKIITSPIKVIDGKPYIYPFEKHYIILALNGVINSENERINKIESIPGTRPKLADDAINASKLLINDLTTVLERFKSMEEVK